MGEAIAVGFGFRQGQAVDHEHAVYPPEEANAWLTRHGRSRNLFTHEYDEWPRGRIVYEKPTQRFVIYADRRLHAPDVIAAVKTAFGLDRAEAVVKSDLHYRRA